MLSNARQREDNDNRRLSPTGTANTGRDASFSSAAATVTRALSPNSTRNILASLLNMEASGEEVEENNAAAAAAFSLGEQVYASERHRHDHDYSSASNASPAAISSTISPSSPHAMVHFNEGGELHSPDFMYSPGVVAGAGRTNTTESTSNDSMDNDEDDADAVGVVNASSAVAEATIGAHLHAHLQQQQLNPFSHVGENRAVLTSLHRLHPRGHSVQSHKQGNKKANSTGVGSGRAGSRGVGGEFTLPPPHAEVKQAFVLPLAASIGMRSADTYAGEQRGEQEVPTTVMGEGVSRIDNTLGVAVRSFVGNRQKQFLTDLLASSSTLLHRQNKQKQRHLQNNANSSSNIEDDDDPHCASSSGMAAPPCPLPLSTAANAFPSAAGSPSRVVSATHAISTSGAVRIVDVCSNNKTNLQPAQRCNENTKAPSNGSGQLRVLMPKMPYDPASIIDDHPLQEALNPKTANPNKAAEKECTDCGKGVINANARAKRSRRMHISTPCQLEFAMQHNRAFTLKQQPHPQERILDDTLSPASTRTIGLSGELRRQRLQREIAAFRGFEYHHQRQDAVCMLSSAHGDDNNIHCHHHHHHQNHHQQQQQRDDSDNNSNDPTRYLIVKQTRMYQNMIHVVSPPCIRSESYLVPSAPTAPAPAPAASLSRGGGFLGGGGLGGLPTVAQPPRVSSSSGTTVDGGEGGGLGSTSSNTMGLAYNITHTPLVDLKEASEGTERRRNCIFGFTSDGYKIAATVSNPIYLVSEKGCGTFELPPARNDMVNAIQFYWTSHASVSRGKGGKRECENCGDSSCDEERDGPHGKTLSDANKKDWLFVKSVAKKSGLNTSLLVRHDFHHHHHHHSAAAQQRRQQGFPPPPPMPPTSGNTIESLLQRLMAMGRANAATSPATTSDEALTRAIEELALTIGQQRQTAQRLEEDDDNDNDDDFGVAEDDEEAGDEEWEDDDGDDDDDENSREETTQHQTERRDTADEMKTRQEKAEKNNADTDNEEAEFTETLYLFSVANEGNIYEHRVSEAFFQYDALCRAVKEAIAERQRTREVAREARRRERQKRTLARISRQISETISRSSRRVGGGDNDNDNDDNAGSCSSVSVDSSSKDEDSADDERALRFDANAAAAMVRRCFVQPTMTIRRLFTCETGLNDLILIRPKQGEASSSFSSPSSPHHHVVSKTSTSDAYPSSSASAFTMVAVCDAFFFLTFAASTPVWSSCPSAVSPPSQLVTLRKVNYSMFVYKHKFTYLTEAQFLLRRLEDNLVERLALVRGGNKKREQNKKKGIVADENDDARGGDEDNIDDDEQTLVNQLICVRSVIAAGGGIAAYRTLAMANTNAKNNDGRNAADSIPSLSALAAAVDEDEDESAYAAPPLNITAASTSAEEVSHRIQAAASLGTHHRANTVLELCRFAPSPATATVTKPTVHNRGSIAEEEEEEAIIDGFLPPQAESFMIPSAALPQPFGDSYRAIPSHARPFKKLTISRQPAAFDFKLFFTYGAVSRDGQFTVLTSDEDYLVCGFRTSELLGRDGGGEWGSSVNTVNDKKNGSPTRSPGLRPTVPPLPPSSSASARPLPSSTTPFSYTNLAECRNTRDLPQNDSVSPCFIYQCQHRPRRVVSIGDRTFVIGTEHSVVVIEIVASSSSSPFGPVEIRTAVPFECNMADTEAALGDFGGPNWGIRDYIGLSSHNNSAADNRPPSSLLYQLSDRPTPERVVGIAADPKEEFVAVCTSRRRVTIYCSQWTSLLRSAARFVEEHKHAFSSRHHHKDKGGKQLTTAMADTNAEEHLEPQANSVGQQQLSLLARLTRTSACPRGHWLSRITVEPPATAAATCGNDAGNAAQLVKRLADRYFEAEEQLLETKKIAGTSATATNSGSNKASLLLGFKRDRSIGSSPAHTSTDGHKEKILIVDDNNGSGADSNEAKQRRNELESFILEDSKTECPQALSCGGDGCHMSPASPQNLSVNTALLKSLVRDYSLSARVGKEEAKNEGRQSPTAASSTVVDASSSSSPPPFISPFVCEQCHVDLRLFQLVLAAVNNRTSRRREEPHQERSADGTVVNGGDGDESLAPSVVGIMQYCHRCGYCQCDDH